MNNEFLPYEQALALKELGFNEPCLTWWYKDEFVKPYWERELGYTYESGISKDCVLAPLYQQAFRWLYQKLDIEKGVMPLDIESQQLLLKELIDKVSSKHLAASPLALLK